jgi:Flp pilus assembly protein TadG
MWKPGSRTRNSEGSKSISSRDPSDRDSGAAIVEMAFIFSILAMLLVGVVTSAIAFGQKNSIENAAREASRFAATAPELDDNWLRAVRDVARSAAHGDLDAGVDGQSICVAHTGYGKKLVDVGGVESISDIGSTGPCYPDDLSDVRVQVLTERDTKINAAFFSIDVTLTAPATARYEREE